MLQSILKKSLKYYKLFYKLLLLKIEQIFISFDLYAILYNMYNNEPVNLEFMQKL